MEFLEHPNITDVIILLTVYDEVTQIKILYLCKI